MGLRNFDVPFKDSRGNIIHEGGQDGKLIQDADGKPKPLLVSTILINVLLSSNPQKEPNLSNADARARGRLADKIGVGGNIEIDSLEVAIIEKALEKYSQGPLFTTRCLDALDKEIPN